MFLGLLDLDLDPSVRGMDLDPDPTPEPFIIKQFFSSGLVTSF